LKPLIVFIVSVLILAALVLTAPDFLLSPGPLMKGHQSLKNNCLSCHQPLKGAASVQCLSCHKPSDIGFKSFSGKLITKNDGKVQFHQGLPEKTCIECHTDHKGIAAAKAIRSFRHELISKELLNNCSNCHAQKKPADEVHRFTRGNCGQCHNTSRWKPATFDHKQLTGISDRSCISCHKKDKPDDKLHMSLSDNCNTCHGTKSWKPAAFDHSRLDASSGKNCIKCHKTDQPNDSMHRLSQASCADCHNTNKWKPATFNHDRYFRLDGDHRASCRTCHTNHGNYKIYTCYGCHEHSEAKIASEHREEGIYNYQNCMKCHRNGGGENRGKEGDWHKESDDD
jgi:hypothetical protein